MTRTARPTAPALADLDLQALDLQALGLRGHNRHPDETPSPVRRCGRCDRVIGDGDWASGHRLCPWCRRSGRSAYRRR